MHNQLTETGKWPAAVAAVAISCAVVTLIGADQTDDQSPRTNGRSRKIAASSDAECPACCVVSPPERPKIRIGANGATYTRVRANYRIPEVTLTDHHGHAVQLTELLGHDEPVAVQFLFTSCPTICPVMAGVFSAVESKRSSDDGDRSERLVHRVSISIDPEHDTPERLADFAKSQRATSDWVFLTGSRDDIRKIQQAFGAYVANKMWHQPLTFLRAGRDDQWLRLNGLITARDLSTELQGLAIQNGATLAANATDPVKREASATDGADARIGDPEIGRRIYEHGILSSGKPLTATVQGDIRMSGKAVRCANCHRSSGFASGEMASYVPPITGPILYRSRDLPRPELVRKMFQDVQPNPTAARIRDPRVRPAYEDESLGNVLQTGVDPSQRQLDQLMPRYELAANDRLHLVAYLKQLGSRTDPGVDDTTIHLATLITTGTKPEQAEAMLAVMNAYVRRKNQDTAYRQRRPEYSPQFKSEFVGALRKWQIHEWKLEGPPNTWRSQLDELYAHQPVFALVSGMAGAWQPIQDFCDSNSLPCIFPQTTLPGRPSVHTTDQGASGSTISSGYVLYLHAGVQLEARTLALHLASSTASDSPSDEKSASGERTPVSVVRQVYRDDLAGRTAANAFEKAAGEQAVRVEKRVVAGDSPLATQANKLLAGDYDALVFWLNADDVNSLLKTRPHAQRSPVYVSQLLVDPSGDELRQLSELADVRLIYPYVLPGSEHPRIYRVRAWLRSRRIAAGHDRIQLNTFFAMSIVDHALMHILEDFSRDYFIEAIEHETESFLNVGVFPYMSLGPGQRYASRGATIVRQAKGRASQRLEALSGWIVP